MEAIFWLVLMVVMLFVEAASVTLVSVWFGAGALAALIATLLGAKLRLQLVIFFAVSIALLLCLRPFVRKFLKPRINKTNVDALVDSQGYVTADIDNLKAQGYVKLGAMEWTARSTDGNPIAKGTLVQVDRIEGVKAYVSPVKVTVES